MVGNRLPANLDLIDLAQTESNQIYVIVEGHSDGQATGPPVVLPTPRPPPGQGASVTFTSGRLELCKHVPNVFAPPGEGVQSILW